MIFPQKPELNIRIYINYTFLSISCQGVYLLLRIMPRKNIADDLKNPFREQSCRFLFPMIIGVKRSILNFAADRKTAENLNERRNRLWRAKQLSDNDKMIRTSKFIFRAACAAVSVLTAVVGYYYAALPVRLNTDSDTVYCSGGFSAAVLRPTDGGCAYYLGAVPIKEAELTRTKRPQLIPCGTPFGIRVRSDGVMVVSVGNDSPAAESGIKQGDVITSVNGVAVTTNNEISDAVQLSDGSAEVILTRGESKLCLSVPTKKNSDGTLKIGAWVRDSAAGIGTMTWYDPQTGKFGGLGHAVSDVTTGQCVPLSGGEITAARISGIVRGKKGEAGELCGSFVSGETMGKVTANTEVGVFGTAEPPADGAAIPMAFRHEAECGRAVILTTVDDGGVRKYDIEIERINLLDMTGSKSMVIRITDPALIEKTGGIVRGMSGSPIIQNGRLVGAVTHVLLNDPTRGYAVFAESMMEEMSQQ